MTKYILILQLIAQGLTAIIQIIRGIEEAIPGQGAGEAKLAAAREILESAYAAVGSTQITFAEIWPVLQKTIGGLVGAFNKTSWR